MDVSAAVEEYLVTRYRLSAQTVRWYRQKLGLFAEWCATQGVTTENLHQSTIHKFLAERDKTLNRYGKQVSSYTTHGYAQVIKGFVNYCGRDDIISEGTANRIAKRIEMPKVDVKVIEVFTEEHIKRMYAACKKEFLPKLEERDKAMIATFLGTGIRAGELVGLTLENLHLDTYNAYIKVTGKGRKQREVPLDDDARRYLARYVNRYRRAPVQEHHVFLSREDGPLTESGVYQIVDRLGEWGGVQGVRCSPHTFRHTFAYRFKMQSQDVYKLSRLLGHSSVTVTEMYLRALPDEAIRHM